MREGGRDREGGEGGREGGEGGSEGVREGGRGREGGNGDLSIDFSFSTTSKPKAT